MLEVEDVSFGVLRYYLSSLVSDVLEIEREDSFRRDSEIGYAMKPKRS